MHDLEALRERLAGLGDELADEAIRLLRLARATSDDDERTELAGAERRVTRARRAVEKAVHLLNGAEPTD